MPKLTHDQILQLGHILGYKLSEEGLCRGFSAMLSQAILAKDEKTFFERLEFISTYNNNLEKLKKEIDAAREQVKKMPHGISFEALDDKTKKLLEIFAFFAGVEVYHVPGNHPGLFHDKYISQDNISEIYPLVRSLSQEKEDELFLLLDKDYAFSKTLLLSYIEDLEKILKKADSALPIMLNSSNHSVCLKYNKDKNTWTYVDTNDFKRYPNHSSYVRELDNKELVKSIFISFFSPSTFTDNLMSLFFSENKYSVFNTTIISNNKEDMRFKNALEALNEKYRITAEQAKMYDQDDVGILQIACSNGHLEIVEKILSLKGFEINNINRASKEGATPLYLACQNGHLPIVQELLKYEIIDINFATKGKVTPLCTACQSGYLNIVQELLKHETIDINFANEEGVTPLYIACQNGHLEIVQELLKHKKININLENDEDITPLYIACQNGHLEIVQELLKHQTININLASGEGSTPLYIASKNGHLEIVQELLKHQTIDINCESKNRITPLYIACQKGHLQIVQELLKHEKINIYRESKNRITPLYIACQKGHLPIVQELLKHEKTDINFTNKQGITLFYIACENGHLPIIQELLKDEKVNVNLACKAGKTPFFIACQEGHLQIIQELLKHEKIDINQANHQSVTPIHIVCQQGNLDIFKLFVESEKNINMNVYAEDGSTPLQAACLSSNTKNNETLFQLLLKSGVNLTHLTKKGQTALDIALANNNNAAVNEILIFAKLNGLQPTSIMSIDSLEKAISWVKEKNLVDLIHYLQPAYQLVENSKVNQVTETVPRTFFGYKIFKSASESKPSVNDSEYQSNKKMKNE